jgi:hypothetical protein
MTRKPNIINLNDAKLMSAPSEFRLEGVEGYGRKLVDGESEVVFEPEIGRIRLRDRVRSLFESDATDFFSCRV